MASAQRKKIVQLIQVLASQGSAKRLCPCTLCQTAGESTIFFPSGRQTEGTLEGEKGEKKGFTR